MPRFILIDPWLAKPGGHNFQYALDVLQCAEARGHSIVLAANEKLPQLGPLADSWQIIRPFRYGVCVQHWLNPDGRGWPCDFDGRRLTTPLPTKGLSLDARAVVAKRKLRDLLFLQTKDRRRRIHDFAAGLAKLLAEVKPTAEDILFLPSMSEFDFVGFAKFLSEEPRTRAFNWHLQFHFNIYVGRDPDFLTQRLQLWKFQTQFQYALRKLGSHSLKFYATTEAMGRQYDRIGVGRFHPLPYPTLSNGCGTSAAKRPLRVTFAGGMRREKGKKSIGRLIAATAPELELGQLEFSFQAPAKQITGWLSRDLRKRLDIAPLEQAGVDAPLRSVRHPLDPASYSDFIQQTDIAVFLYSNTRYFARASGILGEMLAAGVPAIVPAGCWLADQIAPEMYGLVNSECAKPESLIESQELELARSDSKLVAEWRVPEGSADVAIQLNWPLDAEAGTYLKVDAEFFRGDESLEQPESNILSVPKSGPAALLLPVPERCDRVRLTVQNAYHSASVSLQSLRVSALRRDGETAHRPRGKVGLIASTEADVPRLLREMLQHHDHYRQTARDFSAVWLYDHHPDRTIECLEARNIGVKFDEDQPQSRVA